MTVAIFGLIGVIVGGLINGGVTFLQARARRRRVVQKAVRLAGGYADQLNTYALMGLERGHTSEAMRHHHLLSAVDGLEGLRDQIVEHPSEQVWEEYLSIMRHADMTAHTSEDESRADWAALHLQVLDFASALGVEVLTIDDLPVPAEEARVAVDVAETVRSGPARQTLPPDRTGRA